MEGITLKITLQYNEIAEVRRTQDKKTVITCINGDKITFSNGKSNKLFERLSRQKAGENYE